MAPSAPLILPTEVFADLRDPGSVGTPDPWPVVVAHINLAADTDRIGIGLTLDNVVSDADHVLATHNQFLYPLRPLPHVASRRLSSIESTP